MRNAKERSATIGKLRDTGVDVETGAGASTRAGLALREFSPERQRDFLAKEFGAENVRSSTAGFIIKKDGKELLVDESGLTLNDLSDLVGDGIVVGGAIAATLGSIALFPELITGGVLSLAGLAVISALGGQTAGGVSDVIKTIVFSFNGLLLIFNSKYVQSYGAGSCSPLKNGREKREAV